MVVKRGGTGRGAGVGEKKKQRRDSLIKADSLFGLISQFVAGFGLPQEVRTTQQEKGEERSYQIDSDLFTGKTAYYKSEDREMAPGEFFFGTSGFRLQCILFIGLSPGHWQGASQTSTFARKPTMRWKLECRILEGQGKLCQKGNRVTVWLYVVMIVYTFIAFAFCIQPVEMQKIDGYETKYICSSH